jgi:hypothetical protein
LPAHRRDRGSESRRRERLLVANTDQKLYCFNGNGTAYPAFLFR